MTGEGAHVDMLRAPAVEAEEKHALWDWCSGSSEASWSERQNHRMDRSGTCEQNIKWHGKSATKTDFL